MLRVEPHYYLPVETAMLRFFYEQFFAPIIEIVSIPKPKLNSNSALIAAIRSGRVVYDAGVFSGSFNARISADLSKFAKFDRRSKTWKGRPGPDVLGAAVVAQSKREDLHRQLHIAIDETEARINDAIESVSFGSDLPLFAMQDDIGRDLYDVGVMPELTPAMAEKIREEYTLNQELNIKGWMPDQIERLREMVERIQTTSDTSSITQIIQDEWGTSAAKARFLARQETSLLFSKLSLNRAAATGVRRYRWSTSHDQRVRDEEPGGRRHYAPNHKHLDGKIFDIHGDGGIVDLITGRKAHPGQDYNCRCAAIWVLD